MTDDLAADLAAGLAAIKRAPAFTPRVHLNRSDAAAAAERGWLRPEQIVTAPELPAERVAAAIDAATMTQPVPASAAEPGDLLADLQALTERYAEPAPLTVYCEPGQRDAVQAAADEAWAKVDAERPFLSAPPRRVVVAESVLVRPGTVVTFDPAHRAAERPVDDTPHPPR